MSVGNNNNNTFPTIDARLITTKQLTNLLQLKPVANWQKTGQSLFSITHKKNVETRLQVFYGSINTIKKHVWNTKRSFQLLYVISRTIDATKRSRACYKNPVNSSSAINCAEMQSKQHLAVVTCLFYM